MAPFSGITPGCGDWGAMDVVSRGISGSPLLRAEVFSLDHHCSTSVTRREGVGEGNLHRKSHALWRGRRWGGGGGSGGGPRDSRRDADATVGRRRQCLDFDAALTRHSGATTTECYYGLGQASVLRDVLPPTPPGPEGSNGNGLLRVQ